MDEISAFKNLAELDSLLRSDNPSTHYESLFHMPFLFKDFSSPAFIQAGFLKLMDAFQSSENITRAYIVQTVTHCKSFVHLIPQLDDIIDSLFLTAYPSKDPQLLQFSIDIMTILAQAQIYKNPKALFLVMHLIRKSPGENWTFPLWQSLVKILTTFFTKTKHSENQRDILAFKEVSKALHFLMHKSKEIPAELKSQLQLFMDADSLQINHG